MCSWLLNLPQVFKATFSNSLFPMHQVVRSRDLSSDLMTALSICLPRPPACEHMGGREGRGLSLQHFILSSGRLDELLGNFQWLMSLLISTEAIIWKLHRPIVCLLYAEWHLWSVLSKRIQCIQILNSECSHLKVICSRLHYFFTIVHIFLSLPDFTVSIVGIPVPLSLAVWTLKGP